MLSSKAESQTENSLYGPFSPLLLYVKQEGYDVTVLDNVVFTFKSE